jgi:hypothetical protein
MLAVVCYEHTFALAENTTPSSGHCERSLCVDSVAFVSILMLMRARTRCVAHDCSVLGVSAPPNAQLSTLSLRARQSFPWKFSKLSMTGAVPNSRHT